MQATPHSFRWNVRRLLGPLLAVLALCAAWPAQALRIKEVAAVQGVRSNQLTGYGLVVGLDGTATRPRRCPTPPSRCRTTCRTWA